ncbi:hypothetical protein GCM10020254_06070 [Streptomyces goshikiensis]
MQQNMDRLAEVTALAAAYDCQVVVFPEKYTTGYAIDPGQCRELAEHREGPSIDRARTGRQGEQPGRGPALPRTRRERFLRLHQCDCR